MNRQAVILFTGDPRREELRKGLPPHFLRRLHRSLIDTIERIENTDLFVVATTPGSARPGRLLRFEHETLSDQITEALSQCFQTGYRQVILLAGDTWGVSSATMLQAFESLQTRRNAAVIGPSGDGGFYLAGFNHASAVAWAEIPLHAHDAAASLSAHLLNSGAQVTILPEFDDIDSLGDAVRSLARMRLPALQALKRCLASLLATLKKQVWSLTFDLVSSPAVAGAPFRAPPLL